MLGDASTDVPCDLFLFRRVGLLEPKDVALFVRGQSFGLSFPLC